MRFIRKKNILEGEELLYTPWLHWMFVVRHMILSLPYFFGLLILWSLAESYTDSQGLVWGLTDALSIKLIIRNAFLAGFMVILLIFMWRIFHFVCVEYGVTNRRLLIRKGVLRLVTAEIPIDRIESIYCVQGIMGRIFGYGTIFISGIGGRMPVFHMVARPYALRRKICEIIEKNKTITVVHGNLPKTKPASRPRPEEEPMYRYGSFVRVI